VFFTSDSNTAFSTVSVKLGFTLDFLLPFYLRTPPLGTGLASVGLNAAYVESPVFKPSVEN
jgi:hypothetical protein